MRKKTYTQHVGVLLTKESYQKLISITDKMELPISEFVRDIIEAELRGPRTHHLGAGRD